MKWRQKEIETQMVEMEAGGELEAREGNGGKRFKRTG
jgi:hypothetical protein